MEFDPVLVHEWLTRSAERFPEKEALVFGDERWTYRELEEKANALALGLMRAGVQRHDRVLIFLGNCTEAVVAIYGALKAGAAFVVLEGSLKGPKLQYIIQNSGAACLIAHTGKAGTIARAFSEEALSCDIVWVGSDPPQDITRGRHFSWDRLFVRQSPQDLNVLPRVIDADLAALIYTSGSTGQPKGVVATHHNMISAARSIIQYIGNREDDIILNVLPLSFDYGLYQMIMTFMFGGTLILEPSFLYLHPVLEKIGQEKVTGFPVVPTLLSMLLQMKDLSRYRFQSLRYLTNTGAALPVAHIQHFRRLFPHVRLFSMFGLTECKRVGYLPPDLIDDKPSSVGFAMPNCEVSLLDDEGNEVAPGAEGELVIRGANVMQGYWRDPELTEKIFRPGQYPEDRRLHSGDYFRKDEDGFLYFIGRKDDMIKVRGERLSAGEIENTLNSMPGCAEAAVIGFPDELLGQAVAVFIVPRPGIPVTEKDVRKFCSQNLESFAMPQRVEILEALPKTANGKVHKLALKSRVEKNV